MRERLIESSWQALLAPQLALPLSVLLGGVLLHSMNVLITATLLPSIVSDVGGSNLMSWPTTRVCCVLDRCCHEYRYRQ